MTSGVERAWDNLDRCAPADVCARAEAKYDESRRCFQLSCFAQEISVCLADRTLCSGTATGELMLKRFGYFASLSVLSYLAQAKDVSPSGHWIKPTDLRAGDIYYKGSHVLPLDRLSKTYDGRVADFMARGGLLGGSPLSFGDGSVRLLPLPRVPVAAILWNGDAEFPARADLLLDSTCELHLSADVIWSVAMLSVMMMS